MLVVLIRLFVVSFGICIWIELIDLVRFCSRSEFDLRFMVMFVGEVILSVVMSWLWI